MASYKWRGNEVVKKAQKARERGVTEATEFVLDESNKRVPHDEGPLQNSGTTHVTKGGREASVSYNTPYAVRQHEATHYNHPNGREAKYLENAVKQNRKQVQKHIEKSIKRALEG
ncbi:Minor capsid protein [Salinibacillus kushneri]|uniref:Minor capsid protein n=1 Tax=Salinibacillus kushneri TaxID=237682 RepID=A0A1I0ICX4_9BACI|nr:minor capsid protein [Salinibacillus kushneri]SET94725.1 Minor capsid protein [Salinibacillus kushneri]